MTDWFNDTNKENIETVRKWFVAQSPKTDKAASIRNEALHYIANISFFLDNADSTWEAVATYRNQYNLANSTSKAELEQVKKVLGTGFTQSEMKGEGRPDIDPDTGKYGAGIPLVSPGVKLAVAGVLGFLVLRKLRIL